MVMNNKVFNVTFLETNSEFYKDDLRAGAFQYVKTNDTKSDLPSPYEVLFYNYRVQSYMSWRYPQPRSLTRLQIYPIPHEVKINSF